MDNAGHAKDDQDEQEEMLDVVMMRLRTADGLDLNTFEKSYGSSSARSIVSALEPHRQAGLVQVIKNKEERKADGGQASFNGCGSGMHGNSMEHHEHQAASQENGGSKEELKGRRVRLTDPEGFLVSNDIISDVFAALTP